MSANNRITVFSVAMQVADIHLRTRVVSPAVVDEHGLWRLSSGTLAPWGNTLVAEGEAPDGKLMQGCYFC